MTVRIHDIDHPALELAKSLIDHAERDLGPLSDGMRRDLLADNTAWSRERIAQAVAIIRETGQ